MLGVDLTVAEADLLMRHWDKSGDGEINYEVNLVSFFLRTLRRAFIRNSLRRWQRQQYEFCIDEVHKSYHFLKKYN